MRISCLETNSVEINSGTEVYCETKDKLLYQNNIEKVKNSYIMYNAFDNNYVC